MSNVSNLFSQILWGTKPHAGTQSWCQFRWSVWNWSPYSGYQTRNICPNCLSTSQNPHDVALGRKLFSPLEIDVTKDLNKSIMVLLDTTSTCNKPPKKIAQSLIPLGHTMKNYLTHSKATLLTYDNSDLKPLVKGEPLLVSGSNCAKLGLVKNPADKVNWRVTSHGTGTL